MLHLHGMAWHVHVVILKLGSGLLWKNSDFFWKDVYSTSVYLQLMQAAASTVVTDAGPFANTVEGVHGSRELVFPHRSAMSVQLGRLRGQES